MSSLWKDHSGNVAFLHSPLRIQIDAIESIDAFTQDSDPSQIYAAYLPRPQLTKNDLECPICLVPSDPFRKENRVFQEIYYKPVALSCGHVFCLPCLLKACHLDNHIGSIRALLSNICYTERCSTCRQTNVHKDATVLSELDAYVKLL